MGTTREFSRRAYLKSLKESGHLSSKAGKAKTEIVYLDPEKKFCDCLLQQVFNIIYSTAMDHEKNGRLLFARCLYTDGIEMMHQHQPSLCKCSSLGGYFSKLQDFEKRSRKIDKVLERCISKKMLHNVIHMEEGTIGCGYNDTFGRYINKGLLTEIAIYEKDLSSLINVRRLLAFLRYMLTNCKTLKFIYINTDSNMLENAFLYIFQLAENAHKAVKINYTNPKVSRVIFNNGYIFESSVGLGLFEDEFFPYLDYKMEYLPFKSFDMEIYSFEQYNSKTVMSKHSSKSLVQSQKSTKTKNS